MADFIATNIIVQALARKSIHPGAPALYVLDRAMQWNKHTSPDFTAVGRAFVLWTDPTSPFAELLRTAFATEISARHAVLWDDPDSKVRAEFRELWRVQVVNQFARRYHLWHL
jgi:hypothetical protein